MITTTYNIESLLTQACPPTTHPTYHPQSSVILENQLIPPHCYEPMYPHQTWAQQLLAGMGCCLKDDPSAEHGMWVAKSPRLSSGWGPINGTRLLPDCPH